MPVDRVAETFVGPSVIEGVGVFAAEPIAAGRIIYATRPHTSPQPQLCDIQCTTMHEQLLPLVVFLAEMTVVTISTMRIIFIGRGLKKMAASLGFFEVSIWLFAIGQVMSNLDRPLCFAGFAGGFVAGNYLGMTLEQRIAFGSVLVRVITNRDSGRLIELLRAAGCGVTRVGAHGLQGPVEIVFTVIQRRRLSDVLTVVREFDANALYSIDELRDSTHRGGWSSQTAPTLPLPASDHVQAAGATRLAA